MQIEWTSSNCSYNRTLQNVTSLNQTYISILKFSSSTKVFENLLHNNNLIKSPGTNAVSARKIGLCADKYLPLLAIVFRESLRSRIVNNDSSDAVDFFTEIHRLIFILMIAMMLLTLVLSSLRRHWLHYFSRNSIHIIFFPFSSHARRFGLLF